MRTLLDERDSNGRAHRCATLAPFNLQATVRLLQRRPANRIDHWEAERYLRAFQTAAGTRLLVVTNRGSTEAPDLRMEIQGGAVPEDAARDLMETTRWMLGLEAAPAPIGWLVEKEPRLGPVASALRGFRPPCFPTLFETCARVLPFQQLSLDAGTAITGRLVARFGPALLYADREWRAFPSPEGIAEASPESLREAGLSRAKVVALQSLATHAIAGELDAERFRSLSSEAALKRLQALPGIGPWSAAVILLRGLRRMDVFPTGDVGVARNLPKLLGLSAPWSPADASAFAERFGDRRGYLYFLGLGSQLVARGLIGEINEP